MNLITDAWLQVRTESGEERMGSPLELLVGAGSGQDPPVELVAARPDFRQGAYMFLVGLLQTVFTPEDEDVWLDRLDGPGEEREDLRRALKDVDSCFELRGETPFLQEAGLDAKNVKPVEELVLGTAKEEHDHFVKRNRYPGLCESCAALALFVRQANAPAAGRGYRTGLRGGGPLTALLVPLRNASSAPLWTRLWLNVLHDELLRHGLQGNFDRPLQDAFPWMGSIPTSETGKETMPQDCHALHVYWSMPCRFLLAEPAAENLPCPLCGQKDQKLVQAYRTAPSGINYAGAWRHPLSAYYPQKTEGAVEWIARKGQPGGIVYRFWPDFGLPSAEGDNAPNQAPLPVIQLAQLDCEPGEGPLSPEVRVHIAGYDVENAKVRCWYEGTAPVFRVTDPDKLVRVYEAAARLVDAAAVATKQIRGCVLKAWYDNAPKGDGPIPSTRLWQETETVYTETLAQIVAAVKSEDHKPKEGEEDPVEELCGRFLRHLCDRALAIFDDVVLSAAPEELPLKRVVDNRAKLAKDLSKFVK